MIALINAVRTLRPSMRAPPWYAYSGVTLVLVRTRRVKLGGSRQPDNRCGRITSSATAD